MAVRCGDKKFCVLCQASYCFDHWDGLEAALPLLGKQLQTLRSEARWWTADCGDCPQTFFNQMADALCEEGAKFRTLAAKWGGVPIPPDQVLNLSNDAKLSQCCIRNWFCERRRANCCIAYRDLGDQCYNQWYERMGFNAVASNGIRMSPRKIADIVETGLALNVISEHGVDLSALGDTEEFSNWLVHSLLEFEQVDWGLDEGR